MLNLDTEDWNEIFIGCAGGGDSVLTFPTETEKGKDSGLTPATLLIRGECPPSAQNCILVQLSSPGSADTFFLLNGNPHFHG